MLDGGASHEADEADVAAAATLRATLHAELARALPHARLTTAPAASADADLLRLALAPQLVRLTRAPHREERPPRLRMAERQFENVALRMDMQRLACTPRR